MKSAIFVAVFLMVGFCVVNAQETPVCDSTTGLTPEQCVDYTDEGAIFVIFDGRQSVLSESEIEQFKVAIANISDDYVILDVMPEHVVIVQRGMHRNTNEFMLRFFVLNPSGSEIMPVALRRQELYLMINLNNDLVNMRVGLDITAQSPPSNYTLALPAWAIAILAYVGLVVIIYCVMVLTSDWRQRRQMEFEEELQKNYYANTEADRGTNGDIAMKKLPPSDNDNAYAVVDERTKKKTMEIGVQTPRHVAVQVDPAELAAGDSTTKVVIENGGTPADPHYDNVNSLPPPPPNDAEGSGDAAAAKEADDAAAAIEGAVNEGYTPDEAPQPSTNL